MVFGYSGKILWVNLSTGSLQTEPTTRYQEWIGGRGLGSYLLAKHQKPDDSSVDNEYIIISVGPLVATGLPLGTRTAVSARNRLSGGVSYSNVGGDFGNRLKMAGYDAIVIHGASTRPVYLLLENGQAKLIPADNLTGLKITELQQALYQTHGPDHLSFLGIGPAGEKEVNIACLIADQAHAAGWGGSGAIFGAKKLKAVVAIGHQPVPVFDEPGLKEKIRQLNWRLNSSEAVAGLAARGTHGMAGAGGFNGLVPTAVNNIQDEYLSPEESAPITEAAFKAWEVARSGCYGCGIQCLHRYELESDRYGTIAAEGMHANSSRGLASNWGVDNAEDLLIAHWLCNEYGLDVDGVSAAVAFAIECAAEGLIDKNQPDDITLTWGDGASAVKLVRQIGEQRDLGQLLGQGVYRAAQQLGSAGQKLAMTVKKVGINEQGLRSHRAWALGVMTSSRGGGHLGGSPQTENRRISAEVGRRLFKEPQAGVPHAYKGKGKITAWTEGLKAVVDSLGLCYFAYGWYDLSIGSPDELAELLYLATGQQHTGQALHRWGLRCHTLERHFSAVHGGYARPDDTLPERFFTTAVGSGPYEGAHLDYEQVNRMLDEYYAYLGWDVTTGLPTVNTLQQYNLETISTIQ